MASRRIDPNLTAEQLRSVLDYDPLIGIFRWRWRNDIPDHFNRRDAGNIAGWVSRKETGHMKITLCGGSYFLHRLAWLYMTGSWPSHEVDHRDNNPGNNSWENLRLATHEQNLRNMRNRRTTLNGETRLKGARFSQEDRQMAGQHPI